MGGRSFAAVSTAAALLAGISGIARAAGAAAGAAVGAAAEIEHVVLLVMENRPFDMFFGWAGEELPGVDGLSGREFNYRKATDPASGREYVQKGKATYVCTNPAEMSFRNFVGDFFGPGVWNGSRAPYPAPNGDGFLEENGGNAEVMWQFSPEQIPVKTALAKEFAVVDAYYVSFPGPSTPNHLFLHSATSAGCTDTGAPYKCLGGKAFPQKTIYESLMEANLTWAYYYNDSAWVDFLEFFNTPKGKAGMRPYDEFYHRAQHGTLPNYSWIVPRQGANKTTGQGSNDDHPCHDVALGERLLKDTYEALRAGPAWNKTLLLVTYDDTGGWYDHRPPVVGVPAPDGESSCPDKTDFTWTGGRAPMLLISPWVEKGRVIHGPAGEPGTPGRPSENSVYEHSSVPATLKNLFGLRSFLTKRDAWAGSFHTELTEASPRTDTPEHLPDAPKPSEEVAVHGGPPYFDRLTRRQSRRVKHWSELNGVRVPEGLRSHAEAEAWIAKQFTSWLQCSTGRCSAQEEALEVAV